MISDITSDKKNDIPFDTTSEIPSGIDILNRKMEINKEYNLLL